MMQEINFNEYVEILETAKETNEKIRLNVSTPENIKGNRYFKSLEGCSILSTKGELCGLFRFKKGSEDVAKIHQNYRISQGGYWLNCYRGKLDKIYKKQNFKIISAVKFNPNFAPQNWESDKILSTKPDICFMVLNHYHLKNSFLLCENWECAEKIAIDAKK
jgi:hypothetical protein